MIVFFVLVVVLLIGLTTAAVMGKLGGFLADPTSSHSFAGVPDGPFSAADPVQLHFDQGLRGYRMDQVDEVIDALSARLRELETEIASLSGAVTAQPRWSDVSDVAGDPSGEAGDFARDAGDLDGAGGELGGHIRGTDDLSGDTRER